jgi:phosphate starvation-inducible PhoH-like protein
VAEPEFISPGGETVRLDFEDNELARRLFGPGETHLRLLSDLTGVRIGARGGAVTLAGDRPDVELAASILNQLSGLLAEGYPLFEADIEHAARILAGDPSARIKDVFLDTVFVSARHRVITPKTLNQKAYIEAIRRFDLVFGIGPAGTGKTYLAMAMAVAALSGEEVRRIILTRPAVEAGERLGFLPGDLYDKVNPYLRPLYDALHDLMDFEQARRMVGQGVIEVAPLAFMRGRTLNDSFVILDEAQNTTSEQMKMFLTRLGFSSKAVITGDVTQIDLPANQASGLIEARRILGGIEGIGFVDFDHTDVIRHRLVREIIQAYDRFDAGRSRAGEEPR